MKEDFKEDWLDVSLVKDLNYIKTGVENYESNKKYYSTGSIKNHSFIAEGSYNYSNRPSRANRIGKLGDVLQARMKDTDKSVLIDVKFDQQLFSTGFFQIRPKPETLLSKYIFYYFKSFLFLNEKDKNCSGSTQSALNDKSAQKIIIPLAPIPIQKAIVKTTEELFSSLDRGITDLKKAKDQLIIYKEAVLKKAFEGELTKEWRKKQINLPSAEKLLKEIKEERQKHYEQKILEWKEVVKVWEENGKEGKKPSKPRQIKINAINDKENPFGNNSNWKWTTLDELTSIISDGPFGSNLKGNDYIDSGVRVIRLENIKSLVFDNSKKSFVSKEKHQSIIRHTVLPGEIIFSTFIADTTKVTIIPNVFDFAINKADCVRIKPSLCVSNKYLLYYLASRITYTLLVNEVHGATRPRVNTTQLKKLQVPICSENEQHQIVLEIESRLSVCDKVEENIKESLQKAIALRQSILKKAFEGKLLNAEEIKKCKADKDYEPASVLLERIRVEKLKIKK